MPANQKPLNQIGMFWYQFSPLSHDISKFEQIRSTLAVRFVLFLGGHPVL